jgi:glycosyltransferase involved in cell wall biosynthesis
MRVVIASTIVPFIEGGGTFIVDWLESVLREHGHEVDVLRIPFHSYYPDMPAQMLALRLLDISQHGDRLITIRPPAYLLRHPNKVLWFIHHHRGAYDLWGTSYQDLPDTPEGHAYRRAIVMSDQAAFSEARNIYTNSAVVAKRLEMYNGVKAEVLYPPVFRPERYRCGEFGDYILYVSRLARHKRQSLAVEALQYTRTPVKLLLAGKPDHPLELERLETAIKTLGAGDRVILNSAWISDEEKAELYANCLACIYLPFDEDSYGYPSLEAHHAGKAVISTTDAGGTKELIVHGENGFLVEPDPRAIADCMDQLYLNRKLAREMGAAGTKRMKDLGISWDVVVQKLLA